MAMIKCSECGKQISSKAKTCPQCGSPVKKKASKLGLFILLVLFICALVDVMDDSDSIDSGPIADTRKSPKQEKPEVLYICRTYPVGSAIEDKHIRTAPNADAPLDGTGDLLPGERIHVLEDKQEWIRFRVTPEDEGWSAWMPKKFVISVEELLAQREEKFGKCPRKRWSDGSVRIVKDYIRLVAKDPDSMKYDNWSDVRRWGNLGYRGSLLPSESGGRGSMS